MKIGFGVLLFIAFSAITPLAQSATQLDAEKCPDLQGEYAAMKCPTVGQFYQTTKVYQPDCRAIGLQAITYLADGRIGSFGPVRWEPIGSGRILDREDQSRAYLKERFYDSDSLYTYNYVVEKTTGKASLLRAEVIDSLRDGNLLVSYDSLPAGTWFNLKNCPQ